MPRSKTSSESEREFSPKVRAKVQRLRGACDKCRVKKIKCDSAKLPGKICSNCLIAKIPCSHNLPSYHKTTEKQQTYINVLEKRIKKLEAYIQKLHPGMDIYRLINLPDVQTASETNQSEFNADIFESADDAYTIQQSIMSQDMPQAAQNFQEESESLEIDDDAHVALAEDFKKLSVNLIDQRFFGQASAFMFAKHVAAVRSKLTGELSTRPDLKRYRRLIYWDIRPWETLYITSPEVSYIYPPQDLLESLVSLYFEKSNSLIPVLHQPTFMRSLLLGQHHWDPAFGMTVLLVCAIGSRYSQDPRVYVSNDANGLSSGWHYFCQVPVHRKILLLRSSTYDLQYYCLAPLYLLGTSMANAAWDILGIGLRYALHRGAHRRRGHNQLPSVDSELQKRAFWSLVCLEQIGSSFVDRPCAFLYEQIDVDYPVECDDEYWETDDPTTTFRQPPGKPCSITSFISFIKLCEILGAAVRTLYANRKSRIFSGFIGNEWEARMVAELDSSMNRWKDSLPDYLHWDPERQDTLFFHQSVNLHATFYYIQMQIHRPYLTKKSSLSASSFAMCANAARSCARILETGLARGLRVLPNTMTAAFTAGFIIILGSWRQYPSSHILHPERDAQAFQRCVNVLEECERRWSCAGKLCDMLYEASAMTANQPTKNKRPSSEQLNPPTSLSSTNDFSFRSSIDSSVGETPLMVVTGPDELPLNSWDLQKILLTEMGYLPGNNTESTEDLFHSEERSVHPLQTVQTSEFSSGQDGSAFWSDNLMGTSTSSLGEWDAYLASMGQF